MRRGVMYARGIPEAIGWEVFVEKHDDLWHIAGCYYRCAQRMKKLMNSKTN